MRQDESSPVIIGLLSGIADEIKTRVVPDDRFEISAALRELSDVSGCAIILTTGGTGFSPRDITPEATLDVLERQTPGISEAMRAQGLRFTPTAMLSRAVSGIRGRTLIINLPGSPKAVRENLETILPALRHGVDVLQNRPTASDHSL